MGYDLVRNNDSCKFCCSHWEQIRFQAEVIMQHLRKQFLKMVIVG